MAVELSEVRSAAERVAGSHGLEVVEVSFTGSGKFRTLQVFVEKNAVRRAEMAAQAAASNETGETDDALPVVPKGVAAELLSWTTHEDCAAFALDFGTVLDVEELVPGTTEYTLEVSSPGLDRGLFKAGDWERFQGQVVKVKTFEPMTGTRSLVGRMQFANGVVRLDVAGVKQKGAKPGDKKPVEKVVEIPLTNVERAELVPEI